MILYRGIDVVAVHSSQLNTILLMACTVKFWLWGLLTVTDLFRLLMLYACYVLCRCQRSPDVL